MALHGVVPGQLEHVPSIWGEEQQPAQIEMTNVQISELPQLPAMESVEETAAKHAKKKKFAKLFTQKLNKTKGPKTEVESAREGHANESTDLSRWWIIENETRPEVVHVGKWLIDPSAPWKVVWDLFVVLLLVPLPPAPVLMRHQIYNLFMIPFLLAFEALEIWDLLIDALFLLDILFNFFTAQHSSFGSGLITEHKVIARNYVKSWFLPDLLGTMPVDLLAVSNVRALRVLRLPRIVRFAKLMRIMRLTRLGKLEAYVSRFRKALPMCTAVFKVVQLIVAFFYTGHLMACMLYFVGTFDHDETWLTSTQISTLTEGTVTVAEAPQSTQYLVALYWGFTMLSTVGFGDITPKTQEEIIVVLICVALGTLLFSYIVGAIGVTLTNKDLAKLEFQKELDEVTQMLNKFDIPSELVEVARAHIRYRFKNPVFELDDGSCMAKLPKALTLDIANHLYRDAIVRVPIFSKCSAPFIDALLTKLTPKQVGPKVVVFSAGEIATTMFFILSGEMDLYDTQKRCFATFFTGNFFGEGAMMEGEGFHRSYTAVAHTWCDLMCLSRQAMEETSKEFPEDLQRVTTMTGKSWKVLREKMKQTALSPTPTVPRPFPAPARSKSTLFEALKKLTKTPDASPRLSPQKVEVAPSVVDGGEAVQGAGVLNTADKEGVLPLPVVELSESGGEDTGDTGVANASSTPALATVAALSSKMRIVTPTAPSSQAVPPTAPASQVVFQTTPTEAGVDLKEEIRQINAKLDRIFKALNIEQP